jgi:DHA2 family multidrug resistance protein
MTADQSASVQTVSGPLYGAKRWLSLFAAMMGTTVYMMTITTSGTAIPHMQGAFSAAPDQMAWMFTAFIIGTTIVTACSGWISMRFGRKRLYLISGVGFTLASILCGFSSSLEEGVLFRTLQGAFGAPLIPLGQAIAIDAFPHERQGQATVFWSIGGMMGSILGPVLGATLVENYGWPWVFYVNVPFGVLAVGLTWFFVPEITIERSRRFAWLGFAALSIAIAAFELMLSRAERLDWFASTEIVVEMIVAAVAFYLFIIHTATARIPFVDRSILRDRNYVVALAFIFVYGAIVFLQLFLVPILLQDLAGYDIESVATLLSWRGLGLVSGMALIGPFTERVDARIILVFGFLCLVASAWGMSNSTLDVRAADVAWTNFLQGMGSGVAYVPIVMFGFSTLPQRLRTEAVALLYVVSNLGTATGTAVIFNFLVRNIRVNHDVMSERVTPFNELIQLGLVPHLWDWTHQSGIAAMDAEIARQAAIIGYNNSFFLIALSALVVLPLGLLIRMPPRTRSPV